MHDEIKDALWSIYETNSMIANEELGIKIEVDGWMVWMEFPFDSRPQVRALAITKSRIAVRQLEHVANPIMLVLKKELDNDADNINKITDRLLNLYTDDGWDWDWDDGDPTGDPSLID